MDLSVSYVSTTTSSLLSQAAGLARAGIAAQATQSSARTAQQSSARQSDSAGQDSTSWTDGLGDRFASDTANTLLGAQESATTTQSEQTYYYDPLDTNKDGKVTYYEWLTGQKSGSNSSSGTALAA